MTTPSDQRNSDVATDPHRTAEGAGTTPACGGRPTAEALAARAAALLRERQLRKRYLPADLFREPGWDMLIAIYIADRNGHPMNVKSLVAMVDAPATTAQRWIDHLDRLGLVSRATDTLDRRRIEVSLTEVGQTALEAYLGAVER